jgi:hypothetical protein
MRTLIAACFLLVCTSAHAMQPEYFSSRKWVEHQCVTNTTPQNERMFVGRFWPPKYAAILRFHKGITLREIIDLTPFKGKVVQVLVLRADTPMSDHYITISPSDRPDYEIKALDVILLYDDGPIAQT